MKLKLEITIDTKLSDNQIESFLDKFWEEMEKSVKAELKPDTLIYGCEVIEK